MMDIPLSRCRICDRLEDYLRMVAESGAYGPGPVEQYVQGRMDFARRLEPQRFQRKQPDGTTLEIRRNPLPQGGFVTTYTDISELKRREEALEASEESYALVMQGVKEGLRERWDDTNEVTVSPRVKEIDEVSGARSALPLR